MELQVGGQIFAPQLSATQDFSQLGVAVEAVLTGGQQQGDIGVISARQVVLHKHIRVGIVHGNTLVIADLTLQRIRPVFDNTARMGLQRLVGSVHARFN